MCVNPCFNKIQLSKFIYLLVLLCNKQYACATAVDFTCFVVFLHAMHYMLSMY